jgi:hypothetical protein
MAPTGRNTSIGQVPKAASWFLLLLGAVAATIAASPKSPVYVTASFQDRNGLFLENLSKTDIQVFEGGTLREVEFLAMDQLPVVYGLIFEKGLVPDYQWQDRKTDIHEMPGIKSAQDLAYELIDKRLGQQAVWVGAYDQELEVLLEPTTDGFRAKEAVHGIRGVRSPESFLYSALFSAVQRMGERAEKRRVLVVFLDQLDGKTAGKIQPLKNLLSQSNVELFTLSFGSKTGTGRDGLSATFSQAALRDLAKVTCGDVFFASDYRDHLEDVSRRLLGQIRTLHTIGFESEADADKGAKLLVRCSVPGSKVKHHASVPILR